MKDAKGVTLVEAPLSVGVVGAMLRPVWAAVAVIVTDATIVVERCSDDTAG